MIKWHSTLCEGLIRTNLAHPSYDEKWGNIYFQRMLGRTQNFVWIGQKIHWRHLLNLQQTIVTRNG